LGKIQNQEFFLAIKVPQSQFDRECLDYLEDELFKIREELESPDDTWVRTQELWNNIPITFIKYL